VEQLTKQFKRRTE